MPWPWVAGMPVEDFSAAIARAVADSFALGVQLAAPFVERLQDQPDEPDALPARDLFIGQKLRVACIVRGDAVLIG